MNLHLCSLRRPAQTCCRAWVGALGGLSWTRNRRLCSPRCCCCLWRRWISRSAARLPRSSLTRPTLRPARTARCWPRLAPRQARATTTARLSSAATRICAPSVATSPRARATASLPTISTARAAASRDAAAATSPGCTAPSARRRATTGRARCHHRPRRPRRHHHRHPRPALRPHRPSHRRLPIRPVLHRLRPASCRHGSYRRLLGWPARSLAAASAAASVPSAAIAAGAVGGGARLSTRWVRMACTMLL